MNIDDLIFLEQLDEIVSRFDKSLVSVYDNNPQQHNTSNLFVGILGRNARSMAFTTRLIYSGFSRPILCDIHTREIDPNDHSGYISWESFAQFSPNIVLITENFIGNFEDFFSRNKQQLIVDTRQIVCNESSKIIPGAFRAFGNLSDEEIINGTERTGVTVEQFSPSNLIKFIYDLKCFPRGILLLDQYSYSNHSNRSLFNNCFFPSISTLLIFVFYTSLSFIEYHPNRSSTILRQTNSILALTSITLLALVFLIKPLMEFIQWIHLIITKKGKLTIDKILILVFLESSMLNIKFLQQWYHSRCYLFWYSFSFALLHLFFILLIKFDLNSSLSIIAFFFGLLTMICSIILTFIYSPWINERLLWKEYYLLRDYLGPLCLLFVLIHLYLYWYMQLTLINLKFLALLLVLIVLILQIVLRTIQWIKI